jgi:hypothetical protein
MRISGVERAIVKQCGTMAPWLTLLTPEKGCERAQYSPSCNIAAVKRRGSPIGYTIEKKAAAKVT